MYIFYHSIPLWCDVYVRIKILALLKWRLMKSLSWLFKIEIHRAPFYMKPVKPTWFSWMDHRAVCQETGWGFESGFHIAVHSPKHSNLWLFPYIRFKSGFHIKLSPLIETHVQISPLHPSWTPLRYFSVALKRFELLTY